MEVGDSSKDLRAGSQRAAAISCWQFKENEVDVAAASLGQRTKSRVWNSGFTVEAFSQSMESMWTELKLRPVGFAFRMKARCFPESSFVLGYNQGSKSTSSQKASEHKALTYKSSNELRPCLVACPEINSET